MRILVLIFLFTITFSSSAQVITASLEDRSKYLIHQENLWRREKTGFSVGEHVIQIERSANRVGTVLTKLDAIDFSLDIRKIDRQGKLVAKHSPGNGERVFGPWNIVPIEFGGKILLFYSKYENKDSIKVFVAEVDKNNLNLINTKQLYSFQQDNVGIFKLFEAADRNITITFSNDKSLLLCTARGSNENIFTCLFDSNLNILRTKVSNLPEVKKLTITHISLDNKGNNFMAFSETFGPYGKLFTNRSHDEGLNSAYNVFDRVETRKILVHSSDNKERLTDVQSWGLGTLCNATFHVSKDQSRLYVFGDYPGPPGSGLTGIWLTEIETGKSAISKPKLYPYSNDFRKEIYDLGFGYKKKGEIGILPVQYYLVELDNGNLALAGSPVLRKERPKPDNKIDVHYYAGPIIMGFISTRSQSVFTVIPRVQLNSKGSSPIYIPYDDKLIVLYNDTKKNINDTDPDMFRGMFLSKGPVELSLAAAVVDKSGKILSRKVLIEGISKKNCYNTTDYERISNNKMVLLPVSPDKKDVDARAAVISVE